MIGRGAGVARGLDLASAQALPVVSATPSRLLENTDLASPVLDLKHKLTQMSEVVEVVGSKDDPCGVLLESNINLVAPQRKARGGKASRARRLEKHQQAKATTPPAAPMTSTTRWERLAQGLVCQHRANLREDIKAAGKRIQVARAKIRAAFWRAWTCRSLETTGVTVQRDAMDWQLVTGEALTPLSRRDMWILTRAEFLMKENQSRDPHDDIFHPERHRYARHVLDWLRVPADDMEPHFRHTEQVWRGEEVECAGKHTSEKDDVCCAPDSCYPSDYDPYYTSDEDDEYVSDSDDQSQHTSD